MRKWKKGKEAKTEEGKKEKYTEIEKSEIKVSQQSLNTS